MEFQWVPMELKGPVVQQQIAPELLRNHQHCPSKSARGYNRVTWRSAAAALLPSSRGGADRCAGCNATGPARWLALCAWLTKPAAVVRVARRLLVTSEESMPWGPPAGPSSPAGAAGQGDAAMEWGPGRGALQGEDAGAGRRSAPRKQISKPCRPACCTDEAGGSGGRADGVPGGARLSTLSADSWG